MGKKIDGHWHAILLLQNLKKKMFKKLGKSSKPDENGQWWKSWKVKRLITNCLQQISAMSLKKQRMEDWSFSDPSLAADLPLDHELENYVRRNVPKVIFSQVTPTPLQKQRKLVAYRYYYFESVHVHFDKI